MHSIAFVLHTAREMSNGFLSEKWKTIHNKLWTENEAVELDATNNTHQKTLYFLTHIEL